MNFCVTDCVKMKPDIKGIDTYDITKSVIRKHRNTIFKIRKICVYEDGSIALRFYGLGKDYELRLAFWNPEMFELVSNT